MDGKDCEVGIPIVKCLALTPGVEWTRILGEFSWLSKASRPGVAGISFMTKVGGPLLPLALFSPFILVSLCTVERVVRTCEWGGERTFQSGRSGGTGIWKISRLTRGQTQDCGQSLRKGWVRASWGVRSRESRRVVKGLLRKDRLEGQSRRRRAKWRWQDAIGWSAVGRSLAKRQDRPHSGLESGVGRCLSQNLIIGLGDGGRG